MKKIIPFIFSLVAFLFLFNNHDVYALTGSMGTFYVGDNAFTSSYNCPSSDVKYYPFVLHTSDDYYFFGYAFTSNRNFVESDRPSYSMSYFGETINYVMPITKSNGSSFAGIGVGSTWIGWNNSSYNYSFSPTLRVVELNSASGTANINNFKDKTYDEILSFIGSSVSASYNKSLGYLTNIKCDNQTTTFTNGGKEWTNIISYDQLTSTGFDVTTSGSKVEYFFILSGTSGNAFGFGNTTNKMSPYTSQAFSTTGTNFSYNSDLWRSMYENWIAQNNLSSTERVKQAHLTIAAHVVYNGSFGDWVKINEDGSSYLITSSQPFEGTEDPNDITTSIGSSSNVTNTQNGNEIVGTYDQISTGDVDVSQLTGAIRIFVDGGQAFIGLFRTYFSWLPDWVIGFVSLSVAIWAIMIVKRAILG